MWSGIQRNWKKERENMRTNANYESVIGWVALKIDMNSSRLQAEMPGFRYKLYLF